MGAIHAILIGVDRYEPHFGPDGKRLSDLAGCVNDTLRVERYLKEGPFRVPPERIRTLISPAVFSSIDFPPPDRLPTYANIMRELLAVGERVGEGDQVIIHFSGHGARMPSDTAAKGRRGLDEALVPLDGAESFDGGVIRDVEIHALLRTLSATGAYVTMILDSCHSGGAVRGPREGSVRVRGLGVRSGSWGPRKSVLGDWQLLYAQADEAVRATYRPGYRHTLAGGSWLPQPERCVLLAACRGPELAREQEFGPIGVSGAFTQTLLEVLGELEGDISYGALQRRVRERIQCLWATQTPVFEGDEDLAFLGAGRRPRSGGTRVETANREPLVPPDQQRRFELLCGLSTPPVSPIADALDLDLFRLDRKDDWHNPAARMPISSNQVRSGELVCLRVRNRSDQLLNMVVLDLRPEGEAERVHPKRDEGEFAVLEPGHDCPVFLYAWVPDGLERVCSQLKVVVSARPIDARALEILASESEVDRANRLDLPDVGLAPDDKWAVGDLSLTVVR